MERIEVEIIGEAVNACVIRHPEREFPGVLVQGDSLHIIDSSVRRVLEAIRDKRGADALTECEELSEIVAGYVAVYEAALLEEGLRLPYSRGSESASGETDDSTKTTR